MRRSALMETQLSPCGARPAAAAMCDRNSLQIANCKIQISNWKQRSNCRDLLIAATFPPLPRETRQSFAKCHSGERAGVRGAAQSPRSICNLQFAPAAQAAQMAACNLQSSFLRTRKTASSAHHAHRSAMGVPPRCAFTLVELLAALGISVLLIAAVSASLNIYLRVTTTGQAAIERQQVTRALLDRMTRDISSVVFRPAATEAMPTEEDAGGSSSGTSSSSSSSTTTATVAADPTTAMTSTSVGLVGDAQTLLLHISRPLEDLNYADPQSAVSLASRTSDLLSVSYFVAQPGADGLSGAVAAQASMQGDSAALARGSQSPAGLARLEGDRMAMDHADQEQDTAALATAAQVIAPEIATITFRYFDGQAWVETWDSTAMDRLPQAVEVIFGYRDAVAEAETPTALSSVVPISQTVRHVIVVPMAEPAAAVSAL